MKIKSIASRLFMALALGSFINNNANAQSGNFMAKGITLSYYYNTPYDVNVNHFFSGYNSAGTLVVDREHRSVNSVEPGISGSISTYTPLFWTGERSMFAIDLGIETNGYKASLRSVTADENDTYDATLSQLNIGALVGVSYKFGSLASYAKQDRFSWTTGAGVIPSYAMTKYGDIVSYNAITAVPVLYAGIGLFAGFQWTIQARYFPMGLGTQFHLGSNLEGMDRFPTSSRITIKNHDFFQIGIGVNLFSTKWANYRW